MIGSWLWSVRWHIGGRMIYWAAWCVLPPSATRTDLCRRLNEWSAEWAQRLREEKERRLRADIKETTESWKAAN